MKLISLATTDSTSSEAMRRLESGEYPPFMVHAREQTAGRGRRGRQWISAAGNLYVSFALDASGATPAEVASWPLRVAALVCKHLRDYRSLRLKWPNDLVFGGCKIGGVLGESMMQGQDLRAVVIGVGINLHSLPTGDLETPGDVLGADVADIIPRLQNAMVEEWETLRFCPLRALLEEFGLPHGQVWREDNDAYIQVRYEEDGTLVLQRALDGQEKKLASASHAMKWDFRANARRHFLALDVGNSNTRLTWWRDGKARTFSLTEAPWADLPPGWPVFAVSTHREHLAVAERTLARHGLPLFVVAKAARRVQTLYPSEQIGADRLAAMEGYLVDAPRQHLALIVSVGTAVTIDRVIDGRHLGGMILPGFAMALSAMHTMTDALPDVAIPGEGFPQVGMNTDSAMLAGVWHAVLGAIRLAETVLQREYPDRHVEVVVTGGGASSLPYRRDEQLLARGIRSLAID